MFPLSSLNKWGSSFSYCWPNSHSTDNLYHHLNVILYHWLLFNMFLLSNIRFPGSSADKETICNAGDLGSIPGLGGSPGGGKGYPLQYSGLENSMDCMVHAGAKSRTRQSDFHFTCSGRTRTCLIFSQNSITGKESLFQKFVLASVHTFIRCVYIWACMHWISYDIFWSLDESNRLGW